jgi:hypothetical protein
MTQFWKEDPQVLIRTENLFKFFPSKSLNRNENLNAILRLSIYSSIIACVYYRSLSPLILSLVVAIVTIIVNENQKEIEKFFTRLSGTSLGNINDYFKIDLRNLKVKKEDESLLAEFYSSRPISTTGNLCVAPTLSNPFMNPTLDESTVRDTPACDISDPEVKEQTESYFSNNLFRDTSDLFGKVSSQRQFYTIPNQDSISFAKWLYKNEEGCKTNNDFCLNYEDIRANRRV